MAPFVSKSRQRAQLIENRTAMWRGNASLRSLSSAFDDVVRGSIPTEAETKQCGG
jgi:hypothetical protein